MRLGWIPAVVLAIGAAHAQPTAPSPPASAVPPTGTPQPPRPLVHQGVVHGIDDHGVLVGDGHVEIAADGTRTYVKTLLRCKPVTLRGGRTNRLPACQLDPAATIATPDVAAGLSHKIVREPGKHPTLVAFYAGRTKVAEWRSGVPVMRIRRIFLSPDRRVLAAEVTTSKKFALSEDDTRVVIALRLPRPAR